MGAKTVATTAVLRTGRARSIQLLDFNSCSIFGAVANLRPLSQELSFPFQLSGLDPATAASGEDSQRWYWPGQAPAGRHWDS